MDFVIGHLQSLKNMDEYGESDGLSSGPDKFVCWKHFDDYAVQDFIKHNESRNRCDYCNGKYNAVPLELLAEFLLEAVKFFYVDPATFSPYDGEYIVPVLETTDILFDEFGLDIDDDDVKDDLSEWFDPWSAWASEEAYRGEDESAFLLPWRQLKATLMHKNRYSLGSQIVGEYHGEPVTVQDFLNNLANEMKQFDVFQVVDKTQVLYRCRQHKATQHLSEKSDFASPPIEKAVQPNRMSPAGISHFYASFDKEVSAAETIDPKGYKFMTAAGFSLKSSGNVLDLSKIPALPSPFDQSGRSTYYVIKFLREFIHDFSKPIKRDGREHIEYLPTQYMTEFFMKLHSGTGKKIDGLVYPSAKLKDKVCVVFFWDHEQSMEKLDFHKELLKRSRIES